MSQEETSKSDDDWYEKFLSKLRKTSEKTAQLVGKAAKETAELMEKTSKETSELLDKAIGRTKEPVSTEKDSPPVVETKPQLPVEKQEVPVEKKPVSTLSDRVSKLPIPEEASKEFNSLMEEYALAIPGLNDHLEGLFESGRLKNLLVSDKAKDAFYDPGSKQIILPQKKLVAGNVLDVVDAFLFETYNAGTQEKYTELHEEFMAGVKSGGETKAMSLKDYGLKKSQIEAEVTLKHAQALFALQEAEATIAYQGERNLDKVAANILRSRVKGLEVENPEVKKLNGAIEYLEKLLAVDPEVGQITPPERDKELDSYITDIVRGILPKLDDEENAEIKAGIIGAIQNSQHNVKAKGDPTNMTALKTCEVYAMEQLGKVSPKEWGKFLNNEVAKAFEKLPKVNDAPVKPPNLDEVSAWIEHYIRQMNLVDDDYEYPMGQHQAVLDVLAKLQEFYPEVGESLKSSFDETFGVSQDMRDMALARSEKQKTATEITRSTWKNLKDSPSLIMPVRGGNKITKEMLNACKGASLEETLALLQPVVNNATDSTDLDKESLATIKNWLTTETINEIIEERAANKEKVDEIGRWLTQNNDPENKDPEFKKLIESKEAEKRKWEDVMNEPVNALNQLRGKFDNRFIKTFLIDNLSKPFKARLGIK